MFHLMLVGSDPVCLTHGGHEAAGGVVAHTDAVDHGAQHDNSAPCDVPARADCCQALTSCSTSIAVKGRLWAGAVLPSHDAAVALVIDVPLSRIEAPDPPPPKA